MAKRHQAADVAPKPGEVDTNDDPQAKGVLSCSLGWIARIICFSLMMSAVSVVLSYRLGVHPFGTRGLRGMKVKAAGNNVVPKSAAPAEVAAAPQGAARANPIATFNTTLGSFKAEIYLDRVPITASNFIDLAQTGFYNGLHFHRVIPNFMDQFGCPYSKDPHSPRAGSGGPPNGHFKNLKTGGEERRFNGGNIQDEHISRDSNQPGTLSMANTGRPNSGGSQLFLNVHDNSYLDWFSSGGAQHPVFGKLTEGYDVAVAISQVKTRRDNPVNPIKMNSIVITGI